MFGATSRLELCLHQCKVHSNRKLWGRIASKSKPCVSAESIPSRTDPQNISLRAAPYIVPSMEIGAGLGPPRAWCLVCSSVRCISKGSCGEGEPKNRNLVSVQRAYLAGLTRKKSRSCIAVKCRQWKMGLVRGYLAPIPVYTPYTPFRAVACDVTRGVAFLNFDATELKIFLW